MSRSDDAERQRIHTEAFLGDLSRRNTPTMSSTPGIVARTAKQHVYPTSARRYFMCAPLALLGAEIEGGAADLTASSSLFPALNLGGAIPPEGTDIVATFVGDRWVFRYD